ncbi:tumor necrosis factor receptor superfamily member 16 [Electrophorus electricus]|uniref:tumor necrosis factor receptor superfamily member 16 n=1 Tax=Electrophorus electricus TaxID=8005 RepID=UPI0015CFB1EE|nr:tumor necrosis factor receptor superfamily member 16 [Electrophorus electricus]
MDTLLWILFCGTVLAVCGSKLERPGQAQEPCDSGQYTSTGECCLECPPGEGVLKKCGPAQTVCSQCLDSETYSDIYSHTEACQQCTVCSGLLRMQTPCTDSNDAVCMCDYGYYWDEASGDCRSCTVCSYGYGMYVRCEHDHDTVCEPCEDDTFSDQESWLDPCLPCTVCDDEIETQLRECTPKADAMCHDPLAPTVVSPTCSLDVSVPAWEDKELVSQGPGPDEESTTPKPSSPHFVSTGFNENLIPIYCSILAAVLVGVLAYVIFKRWNSCKQNKQAANNRAAMANQTPSPEGEKLHSDSGISVDSQSLQEQQAQQQLHGSEIVVRVDGGAQSDPPPPQP